MNTSDNPPEIDPWQATQEKSPLAVSAPTDHPVQIGRYRIEKVLGEGGYGRVYLAHDDQLNRLVAIKVPRRERVSRPEEAKAYLAEARALASLDHPNIVPVYDAGTTPEGQCYVVSKVIEGCDLARTMRQTRLSHAQAAELTATVAAALHHAHRQGLVHRDIKPGNILLDTSGKAYVSDFGLALKEENFGKEAGFAGTPAYMSPEQARGEGHRVDGRSDIFSLGVVFYELLVGRRPFQGDSLSELLEQITTVEARPLRQVDDTIPKELERICFKALSKRASERYMTAQDMADDLRHFLAQGTAGQPLAVQAGGFPSSAATHGSSPMPLAASTPMASASPSSDSRPIKVVPKGLRSFDAHDADFFLELLPGPRDREGLPDSLRFWKTRIEETDPDNTFSVGLIYGPSGCGKSSLVKAGLLPRLSHGVLVVYVEATALETEARLLNGLRKRCPGLPAHLGLKESLTALRRGQDISVGPIENPSYSDKKVLIVLDQFEQWLHAKREEQNTELMQALRQCDGGKVQCIVMVRDDFWMAATRFMRELEIRFLEGQNSAAVDLFDGDHAKKVLTAFGRAFGKIPEQSAAVSKDQREFLKQAVQGFAQEGKVNCVRLSLFAELMKSKAWTSNSLKEVGGTRGIGATFLEEAFSAASAPPEHRYHQQAARAVLQALLPESGSDIKGHMRSFQELLEASGYAGRPRDFDDLIRILDSEIRLITPTDPEGKDEGGTAKEPGKAADSSFRYYQLTHDYLVPSLRDWLTRKQKETRRGRAELLLADRAAVWNARPENRQLPSLWQWCSIRWWTRKKNWTPPQRLMMRRGARVHALRGVVLALMVFAVSLAGLGIRNNIVEQEKANYAAGLVQRLLDANITQVPGIIKEMETYRAWTDPLLKEENEQADSPRKLNASLALLPVDPNQKEFLYDRLLDAAPYKVAVLRDALAPYKDELLDRLWALVEQPAPGQEQARLRAASALAAYDPLGPRWDRSRSSIVDQLVAENPVFLGHWMDGFRPIKGKLLAPLANIYRDSKRRESERTLATSMLADYAADQPRMLADLVMDADEKQFAVLFAKLKDHGERGLTLLRGEVAKDMEAAREDAKEKLAQRQANAAVALLKMNQPAEVWPLLKHSPDPSVRSYLIHRLGPLGADVGDIVKRWEEEPDVTVRRALLLSLGEFGEEKLPPGLRKGLTPKLQHIYRTNADPGLHASAAWLLRQWQEEAWLKQMNEEWAKDQERREKRLEGIKELLTKDKERTPQWYVNGQGQTMVVIPGPVEFMMGSPSSEEGRQAVELQHKKRIGRTFAIAAQPVTVGDYRRFDESYTFTERYAPTPDCPVVSTSWYEAAAYCNWLSEREGIPPDQRCYETDQKGQVTRLKGKYLSLTGYRLPTEAEMEYATRAGAVTSRYYGATQDLLGKYAWFLQNSGHRSWPVGSKMPNDLGLFDAHGNVWCWCQERFQAYLQGQGERPLEDKEDALIITSQENRVLRGGSFSRQASIVRSASRFELVPTYHLIHIGFRAARTLGKDSYENHPR